VRGFVCGAAFAFAVTYLVGDYLARRLLAERL
jgi:hypothetical protein